MKVIGRRLTVVSGNLLEIAGILVGVTTILLMNPALFFGFNVILLLIGWGCLWYFPHCLSHYIVGRLSGIRFTHYVVGRSALMKMKLPFLNPILKRVPVLGIRMNRSTLDQTSPRARHLMFSAGAYSSMSLPLITVAYAAYRVESSVSFLFAIISVLNIGLTLYYSPKAGDVYRARTARSQGL